MLNSIIVCGRLTRDVDLHETLQGYMKATTRIAIDRDTKGNPGEPTADFINLVAWNKCAKFLSRNCKKGSAILACGRLQSRDWKDKDGNRRITYEIVASRFEFMGRALQDIQNGEEAMNVEGADSLPETDLPMFEYPEEVPF